jgi:hypothetical protein
MIIPCNNSLQLPLLQLEPLFQCQLYLPLQLYDSTEFILDSSVLYSVSPSLLFSSPLNTRIPTHSFSLSLCSVSPSGANDVRRLQQPLSRRADSSAFARCQEHRLCGVPGNLQDLMHSVIHSFIQSFIQSIIQSRTPALRSPRQFARLDAFSHSFVHSIVHSFNHSIKNTGFAESQAISKTSCIQSFIRSFNRSIIQSLNHSIIQSFNHSIVQSINHSINHSIIHSIVRLGQSASIDSFIHSPIHSLIHSFIHSPVCLILGSFNRYYACFLFSFSSSTFSIPSLF